MLTVSKSLKAYSIIEQKAGSNILLQGISGVLGFPFTILADVGVVFSHYSPMINEIRNIYGLPDIDIKALRPIIEGCSSDIIADLIVDKIGGHIPVLGIPFNMMCAKAMTWRLGILFTMLSARGLEVNTNNVKNATLLICKLFPQKKALTFSKPSVVIFEKLVNALEDESIEEFDNKVVRILDSLND